MSFSLHELRDWLQDAGIGMTLHRSDGRAWTGGWPDRTLRSAVLDSRQAAPEVLFCGVRGERTHGARFLGSALAAGSPAALVEGELTSHPGGDALVIVVADARGALEAAARGWLRTRHPVVVGITGSNGKTTTKDLLRSALRGDRRVGANPGNLNSGWGLPLAVLGQDDDCELLVLEMGASAPNEIGRLADVAKPRVGCVTNVAAAHLEQFGTVAEVERTKGQLLEALPADGVAVLNRDDSTYERLRARSAAKRSVSFGVHAEADLRLERCEQRADGLLVRIAATEQVLPLFGLANGMNAAAASTMARELGVPVARALQRMATTSFSPHRSRLLHVGGRTILDDCYNANPISVRSALQSLVELPVSGQKVAVLGDMAELGAASPTLHQEVIAYARALGVHRLVLPGSAMRAAARELGLEAEPATDTAPAKIGRDLAPTTRPGDAVLLKGSRSAALEVVLDALIEALEESAQEED